MWKCGDFLPGVASTLPAGKLMRARGVVDRALETTMCDVEVET